jgi:predicted DNA-binding protein
MPKPRSGTSYRLSKEAQDLLGRLACRLGLTKTSVLEMAIRKLAYAELGEEKAAIDPRVRPGQRPSTEAFVAGHNI